MERQFSACQTHRSKYPSIFNSFRVIRCLSPKNAIFTTFWFPLGSPWGNHAKCCMDGKRIRCLQIVSLHVPTITVSEIQRDIGRKSSIFFIPPCQTPRSMYPSMFIMQFPSYSNLKCKKSPFSRTAALIFVSPGDATATITQYVPWIERQFNACQIPRCVYLSIFNSFRLIWCSSQCVSPKIAIFT